MYVTIKSHKTPHQTNKQKYTKPIIFCVILPSKNAILTDKFTLRNNAGNKDNFDTVIIRDYAEANNKTSCVETKKCVSQNGTRETITNLSN